MAGNKVQISFRVEELLKRQFYSQLELDGMDVVEFMLARIEEYLAKSGKNQGINQQLQQLREDVDARSGKQAKKTGGKGGVAKGKSPARRDHTGTTG